MVLFPIVSKADQVKNWILAEIEKGAYDEGDRLPSDNELIRDLQVSRNTVREALSSLSTEGHVIRIQGKGTYVTRKKDAAGGEDASPVVHLIVKDIHGSKESNPFVGEILRGALRAAEESAASVRLSTFSPGEWFLPPEKIEQICSDNPKGVVFAGFAVTSNIIKQFHQANVPCMSIGRPSDGVSIPHVEVNHRAGARMATQHLLEKGHRRIAYLDVDGFCDERTKGVEDALTEAGIEFSSSLFFHVDGIGPDCGRHAVEEMLSHNVEFSAVLSYGDYCTLGVIQALAQNGIRVPDDVSVVMYGGYPWVSKVAGLELTRVEQPVSGLGERAIELLLNVNEELTQEVTLETALVEGASCVACVCREEVCSDEG